MKPNISKAFVEYMEDLGLGTFAEDIFIGGAPLDVNDPIWWVIAAGGVSDPKNNTGERIKKYTLEVYYRDTNEEDVYNLLQTLEEDINGKHCTQLNGYETVDMEAVSFPTDRDLDNEDRKIGMLQVIISVYQSSELS
jgi:hypothetical protein